MKEISKGEMMARIWRACDKHGSQRKFGKHIGVSAAFISSVLMGRKPPSKKVLDAIGVSQRTCYMAEES